MEGGGGAAAVAPYFLLQRDRPHGEGCQVAVSLPNSCRLKPCMSTSTRWML